MMRSVQHMVKCIVISVMVFTVPVAYAQTKMSKEDEKLKKEADYYFGFADYTGALAIYEKLIVNSFLLQFKRYQSPST